jgi:UPF0176 protein
LAIRIFSGIILFIAWDQMEVLGRIYVAHEGINAHLSVPAKRFDEFKEFLDSIYFLENVRLNIAIEHDLMSFLKLKGEGEEEDRCRRA